MTVHWRAAGVSLALDCSGPRLPRVLHWGADLGNGPTSDALPWWAGGVELTGRTLAVAGVQAPVQFPERLVLIRATRRPLSR
jgi:hypothetical protein